MSSIPTPDAATVRQQFAEARARGLRAREAAQAIGLTEGAVIEAHSAAHGPHDQRLQAVALRGPWIELLKALEPCGPLMALTRNESVVHEKTGPYDKLSGDGPVGLAVGEQIDLRLFFTQWHAGYAVTERAANPGAPDSTSLQFFDASGTAVHKIFTREGTDLKAWNAVRQAFAQPEAVHSFGPLPKPAAPQPDSAIDQAGFAQAWSEMTDTHQFFGLLKRFGVERQQGLRLVEGRFAHRMDREVARALLNEAVFDGTPIMVFVGSPGCIQIHSGPIQRVEPMTTPNAQWINVLDPGFNLHLREDRIAHAWLVEKPTSDGVVTSVELFDVDGELVTMFFGARKPGQPELPAWRALVARLPRAEAAVA